MKRTILLLFIPIFATISLRAQLTFSISDLLNVKRVSDAQIAPDGNWVAYTVGTVNKDSNKVINQIFVMSIDGSKKRQVTNNPSSSSTPRWAPDGKRIAFVSGGQIWTMDPDGDHKDQVTKISSGAGGPVWSPDSRWIAFGSDVYPDCTTDQCNAAEDARVEKSPVQAHVTDRLLFRHWVEWRDRKRSHVFVVSVKGGTARDMTPGDFDSPPYAAATGDDYAFSPNGKDLVYLRNPDKIEAISTNSDIYMVSIDGGGAKDITASMHGYDVSPIFTPDGRYILFRSQATAAFEADRWRIMRYDRQSGAMAELTKGFDLQVDEMALTPDGKNVVFTAGERGREPIFSVPVDGAQSNGSAIRKVLGGYDASSITTDGKTIVFLSSTAASPTEVSRVGIDGAGPASLTSINDASLTSFALKKVEDVEWTGAMGKRVHGFLLKPSRFDPSKKYPLLVLIHGGPQGAWSDSWGYRWNPQVFANQGYVVFMPNQRGSTGYGQQFVNEVSGDWGGKAFVDITNGIADVIRQPYIDKDRIGAAGASYGGYMVDWLLGHNNDPRFKIKAFVSHAGVYNLESMAGATEELWFARWEFKGFPWEDPTLYNKWSPNKFAKTFSTPTLVSCGEIDFRVPYDQSLQLYTTLQIKGVPSKLIVFPDEGHWIQKPQNSEFWYTNVLDWFKKYLNP